MTSATATTFVGRADELDRLLALLDRAERGRPAVGLIAGEAGVGKTRLLDELAVRADKQGARVLVGGCMEVGDVGLPYVPFVDAFRDLGARPGEAELAAPLVAAVPSLGRLLPELGAERGSAPPPGDGFERVQLFDGVLSLLMRLSELAPLLLVIEDLHWADRSTRDLLAFLVRNLRRERVLLVVTYRNDEPGQQRLGPYLAELDRGGPVLRIELARLDQVQTGAQLVGILGAAPAVELVEDIFIRSEGNPFFTEELLAAVRAGSGELPATLRDLLRGRVQVLPEQARQVLAVVAVAGRRGSHRLLATVAGLTDRQLDGALREAV
ncbi:MAG TPA: AAA family ATPase, partial [Actinomycetes bacterium]|nr:AAA family ATPase [Actinomycetes bacterium]